MLINKSNLPSKSLGSSIIGEIELLPMTYKELLDYNSNPELSKDGCSTSELMNWDILYILKPSVPEFRKLSSFDLNFLISLRKMISIIKDAKFSLRGRTYSLESVGFTEISDEVMKIDSVLDRPFRVASVGEVIEALSMLREDQMNLPIELIVLATDMGVNVDYLLNLPADKSATIEYMKTKVMSQPKVGGEEDVILFEKSSDLFQGILELRKVSKLEIRYATEVSH